MRRNSGIVALVVVLAAAAMALAQPGPKGPGPFGKKDGPGKFEPGGGPGGKKDGPAGPEDLRQLRAEVERLKATLTELEARLEHLKQGHARTAGGFSGPPPGGHGKMDFPPKKDGPHFGRFGSPPGNRRLPASEFVPPRERSWGHREFAAPRDGFRGGFAGPPGGFNLSIERKLDVIQKEFDEVRREIHGARR